MPAKEYSVIIPKSVSPKPSPREISAAYILSDYFKANVKFIPRSNQKTPDFLIKNLHWELKTPTGTGKRNLQHVVSRALKQSPHIIIDARFSKIHIARIKNKLSTEAKNNKQIKHLLLITKQKQILVIK